jgi:hypothetical protein
MDGEFGITKDELKASCSQPLNDWSDKLGTIDYDTLVYADDPRLDHRARHLHAGLRHRRRPRRDHEGDLRPAHPADQGRDPAGLHRPGPGLHRPARHRDRRQEGEVYAEYDARLPPPPTPSSAATCSTTSTTAASTPTPSTSPPPRSPTTPPSSRSATTRSASARPPSTPPTPPRGCRPAPATTSRRRVPARHRRRAARCRSATATATSSPDPRSEDSPVECHDGSLMAFAAAPDVAACAFIKPRRSCSPTRSARVSRAYPPTCPKSQPPATTSPSPACPPRRPATTPAPPATAAAAAIRPATSGSGDAPQRQRHPDQRRQPPPARPRATADSAGDTADMDERRRLRLQQQRRTPPDRPRLRPARPPRPAPPPRIPIALALVAQPRQRLSLTACGDDGDAGSDASTTLGTDRTTSPGTTDRARHHRRRHHRHPHHHRDHPSTGDEADPTAPATPSPSTTDDPTGSQAGVLLEQLNGTVWVGEQTRERRHPRLRAALRQRLAAVERAAQPLRPARVREMRAFKVEADGKTAHSTVIQPPGWPVHPENGRMDDWRSR